MINKRLNPFKKIVFKMSRTVAPVNVSPFIKAVRWSLLILGIFYGTNRLHSLRAYEEKAGPKRMQEIHAKHERIKAEDKARAMSELVPVAKDFEVTEFPPNWEKDL